MITVVAREVFAKQKIRPIHSNDLIRIGFRIRSIRFSTGGLAAFSSQGTIVNSSTSGSSRLKLILLLEGYVDTRQEAVSSGEGAGATELLPGPAEGCYLSRQLKYSVE